jgi:hypothetical protein
MKYYKLVGDKVEEVDNCLDWARSFEIENRIVDKTRLDDGVEVSTVFLGIDHNWHGNKPLLFETMIFGGEHNEYCQRYSTYEQAFEGHWRVVKQLKSGLIPNVIEE